MNFNVSIKQKLDEWSTLLSAVNFSSASPLNFTQPSPATITQGSHRNEERKFHDFSMNFKFNSMTPKKLTAEVNH